MSIEFGYARNAFELLELAARESAARAKEMFLMEPCEERAAIIGYAQSVYDHSAFWSWLAKESEKAP